MIVAKHFSDIDECEASVRVCDVNAICQNTLGSHVCSCKAGFTGDGETCTGEDMLNVLGERVYVFHRKRDRKYTYIHIIFFSARERAQFNNSCNLIGSWRVRNFFIRTATAGGIRRVNLFS